MLNINGLKFAKNKAEFLDSLFAPGGSAVGTYRKLKGGIQLFKATGELFAFIVANKYGEYFFVSATMKEGRAWYNLGLSSKDHEFLRLAGLSYSTEREIACDVARQCGFN